MYGSVNVVNALVSHPDIDLNVTNVHGNTALMLACNFKIIHKINFLFYFIFF